jgi:hypothetical protein
MNSMDSEIKTVWHSRRKRLLNTNVKGPASIGFFFSRLKKIRLWIVIIKISHAFSLRSLQQ